MPNIGLPAPHWGESWEISCICQSGSYRTHPTLPRLSFLGGISGARPGNMQDYIKKLQAGVVNFLYFIEQTIIAYYDTVYEWPAILNREAWRRFNVFR